MHFLGGSRDYYNSLFFLLGHRHGLVSRVQSIRAGILYVRYCVVIKMCFMIFGVVAKMSCLCDLLDRYQNGQTHFSNVKV